jgi:hypothetical protein
MRTLLQIRSEILRLKWHVAATRFQYAMRKHAIALKAGFDPDQPRDELGQWTDAGGDDEDDTDNEGSAGSQLIDELSSAERPKGHHFVPRSIYRDLPLSPETRAVLDRATTGPLQSGPHGWSKEHDVYNKAAREHFERFMSSNGIVPEKMTAVQAKDFVENIRQSTDPRIRDFNLNLYRRELNYILRFGPRRPE